MLTIGPRAINPGHRVITGLPLRHAAMQVISSAGAPVELFPFWACLRPHRCFEAAQIILEASFEQRAVEVMKWNNSKVIDIRCQSPRVCRVAVEADHYLARKRMAPSCPQTRSLARFATGAPTSHPLVYLRLRMIDH